VTAIEYLRREAQAPCTTRALVAQGILWAEASCRIDGTMAMALRRASGGSGLVLLDRMMFSGVETMADAASWLNKNREGVLRLLNGQRFEDNGYTASTALFD
jgi:hypothetical protein